MSSKATGKQTRVLLAVIILALTQLILGVSSVLFLKKADTTYSHIIDTEVPILNHLRGVAKESADIHRFCLNILLAENPSEIKAMTERIRNACKKNDERLKKIGEFSTNQQAEQMLNKLKSARDTYIEASQSFIDLASGSGRSEASVFRVATLRPAFEAYQAAQAEMAEYTQISADQASDAATAQIKSMQTILIGFASGPFVIGLVLLLISTVYFIYFIWSVREAAD
jgi:hypothetical protein